MTTQGRAGPYYTPGMGFIELVRFAPWRHKPIVVAIGIITLPFWTCFDKPFAYPHKIAIPRR